MKENFFAMALLTFSVLFSGSCSKESDSGLTGSYTYKISGTVSLMASQLAGLDAATLAAYKAAGMDVDPFVVGLYPEQGQMHIIKSPSSDDRVIITFNDILGNADVTEGTTGDDSIMITGTDLKAAQLTDGSEKIGAGMVAYSGEGKKYDDMLIIDLDYRGTFTVNGVEMTVVDCDINCVAQKN